MIINARNFARAQGAAKTYLTVLNDTNTVGWYIAAAENLTYNPGDSTISAWDDESASNNDLAQSGEALQPIWSDPVVYFAGTDLMQKAFTLAQPEYIYIVFSYASWDAGEGIIDGQTLNTAFLRSEINVDDNEIRVYAGSGYSSQIDIFAQDAFGLVRIFLNGASSYLKVNDGTVSTSGNWGSAAMDGFTVGARANGSSPSNISVKEIIIRKAVDSAEDETLIVNYLNSKYSLW